MSKKTFEIRPLTGSNTANMYTDKENPLYDATIETQNGFKTYELKIGKNTAWNSELRGTLVIRREDSGDNSDLHIYVDSENGKSFDLNRREIFELRIYAKSNA